MLSATKRAPDAVELALRSNRRALFGVAIFSAVINVLMLTSPLFMLQVYDRVLTSRSMPTLVALFLLVALLLVIMGALDSLRSSVLIRIGFALDRALRPHVFDAVIHGQLARRTHGDGQQPVRDLDIVRNFLSGPGPVALFDLPWLPLYIIICFLLHPLFGVLAIVGAFILVILTYWGYRAAQAPTLEATILASRRNAWIEGGRRNAESLRALGMFSAIRSRWDNDHVEALSAQMTASESGARISAFTKSFRILLQSALLAAGAYLVIRQVATPGVMIAASIIAGRALAPIEQAIAQWRPFLQYRESRARLGTLPTGLQVPRTALPRPEQGIALSHVAIAPPGANMPVLAGVNFRLNAGQAMAVIGPSGAGKSTLARGLINVWPIVRGDMRLDGAELQQWHPEEFGAMCGYLPQTVELFDGTVADNIARFSPKRDDAMIVAAADMAGATPMILKLPNGFDTLIGDTTVTLSAGQRQRIGLARALYNDPFLVVLDEPNSNLDADGEAALSRAIRTVRNRKGIVVVMAHRPSALAEVDQVLVIQNGMQTAFGPRDDVLRKAVTNPGIAGKPSGITAGAQL